MRNRFAAGVWTYSVHACIVLEVVVTDFTGSFAFKVDDIFSFLDVWFLIGVVDR